MVNVFMPPPPKELKKGETPIPPRSTPQPSQNTQMVRPMEETTMETPEQVSERKEIKNDKTKLYFVFCCIGLVLSLGAVGLMIYLLI